MALPIMDKPICEKLVLGLERASNGLMKNLGESFEVTIISGGADEIIRL